MNKKGFTTIELLVSFVLIVILLSSLISFTITYRDKVKMEEIKSELIDFKNVITKTIYDDIINLNYVSITSCVGQDNCAVLTDESGGSHVLKVENKCSSCTGSSCQSSGCGVYLNYNETEYLLPDSNLNAYTKSGDEILITKSASILSSFELKNEQNIYSLKVVFRHFQIKDDIEILVIIN